jgi:hypothetical protein
MLIYILVIWNTLLPLGIFYGHLGNFVVIWYIFHRFGILYQEKSGNPGKNPLKFFSAMWSFFVRGTGFCSRSESCRWFSSHDKEGSGRAPHRSKQASPDLILEVRSQSLISKSDHHGNQGPTIDIYGANESVYLYSLNLCILDVYVVI